MTSTGFLPELRRRRVLPVAGAYVVVAWLVTEIASFLLEQAGAPSWALRLLAIVFIVGFPVAVVLAWVIQKEPGGKRVFDSSKGQGRIVIGAVALGVLITAGLAWLILPRMEDVPSLADYHPLPHSVAILPFTDADDTPNERTVAETLYTALMEGLDQSGELTVIRLRLDEPPAKLVEFGRSIRVVALLSGNIVQEPERTRIGLELLDVGKGDVRWRETFGWDPSRIMDIGTDLANGVLGAMDLGMLTRHRFTGTDNQGAYEAYLTGVEHIALGRLGDLAGAIGYFQRAVDLDPDYVNAYVQQAMSLRLYARHKGPTEAERQALDEWLMRALNRALELDPDSAAAISMLGRMSDNIELRIQSYERALELDPDHVLSYERLAWAMTQQGRLEDAERLWRRALELNPMNANNRAEHGMSLLDLGRVEEAVAEVRRSIELEPEDGQGYRMLGQIEYFERGRLDRAVANWRLAYSMDPEEGGVAAFVAAGYADLGAREEALAWLEHGLRLSPTAYRSVLMSYFTPAYLGDQATALERAEQVQERYPGNFYILTALGDRDIAAGQAERAIQRWQDAFPSLANEADRVVDLSNIEEALAFAGQLLQAGQKQQAHDLLRQCLPVANGVRRESFQYWHLSRIYAMLGRKTETLDASRRLVIDGQRRWGRIFFDRPEFDFLRDDPEFRDLMQLIEDDIALQLERVREMERNGEMPPAPGVELFP